MSNDISYIIKVQDSFSKNNARLGKQIDEITGKILNLDSQLKKIQGNLNINVRGGFIDSNAIIRPLNEIQQKLKEFSWGNFSTLGKIQRANQHTIRSNKELARSFSEIKDSIANPKPNNLNPKPNNPVPNGNNITFRNVAKAMGFYKVVDAAVQFPSDLINTRRQIDSLNASLEAILPQYDKTKSASQLAAEEFDYLTKTTYRLGVSFDQAKEEYVRFLAASAGKKDSLQDVRRQFEAFASLSRIYGIAPYRFGLIMNALTQMKSKGLITLEELQRQLGDSLPGAVKLFSDALGMSEAQFRKLLSTSGVSANVLKKVAEYIFNDSVKMNGLGKATTTLDAKINRLNNSWEILKITLTEGDAAELVGDGVWALDQLVQGLTFSVKGLGQAWSDMKGRINEKLHPEIKREKVIKDAKNFNDFIRYEKQEALQMSFPTPANNNMISAPQEVEVKVVFVNAPDGTQAQISTPSKGGRLGVTTEGY